MKILKISITRLDTNKEYENETMNRIAPKYADQNLESKGSDEDDLDK